MKEIRCDKSRRRRKRIKSYREKRRMDGGKLTSNTGYRKILTKGEELYNTKRDASKGLLKKGRSKARCRACFKSEGMGWRILHGRVR